MNEEELFKKIQAAIPKLVKTTVAAIITQDKKILLEKRNGFVENAKWCLPGGHIDFGETAQTALKREIKEEIGLDTQKVEFLGYFDEIMPEIKNHSVVLVYKAETTGKIKMQKSEVAQVGWFTKQEIAKLNMAFKHQEMIKKYWGLK